MKFKMANGEFFVKFKNLFYVWGPPIIWAGLIYYLSSRPGLSIGDGAVDFWTRKPAHVGEYAVLLVLIFRAVGKSFGKSWKFWEIALWAVILTFFYAVSDEIHQFSVPTRSGKIMDLGFDLIGILFGVALTWFYRRNLLK
ncbi:MAG: VanZ family protein [Patescibacteria group bacterium]